MDENRNSENWFEDYAESEDTIQVQEYDITASPNDFNVMTLFSFLKSGSVRIPGFQRNFIWDRKRASKLIESIILGLPIPQLFLYEQERNLFLVIDGQQRLMSIYYFIRERFPRREKRGELRRIFDQKGDIPENILEDNVYFQDFSLFLPDTLSTRKNRFDGLSYSNLGEYKSQLDLRPIRNIVVKQNEPKGDDSSVYEVFSRLNSGGVNLRPQELRTSMYHSDFYDMLYDINTKKEWRNLMNSHEPDMHMKDIEILLRGFAMLINGKSYAPSMVRFLNEFSKKCTSHNLEQNQYLRDLFDSFLNACSHLPNDAFINKHNNRFHIALYEAVFAATCGRVFSEKNLIKDMLDIRRVESLKTDQDFIVASSAATTGKANVEKRLNIALRILGF